ncbi:unnamed protein product [Rotaria magnacalcarata]|uniref:Apple domain-containing protein n=1 Tax=Rotaria magnacalcarata TaxID=392030 RepID=A0A816QRF1_9BILA|nr:unnamed protein product [Rotaria magnacalcarata]
MIIDLLAVNSISAGSTEKKIIWTKNNTAKSCGFHGNDLSSVQIPKELCLKKCEETFECTHFTWTEHYSGTCWMKKGLVSKNDAFQTNDSTTMCGLTNDCRSGSTSSSIRWSRSDWAQGCGFRENDLSNVQIPKEHCLKKCENTFGCTHFTWTEHFGSICWMKKGLVSKNDAFQTGYDSTLCGMVNDYSLENTGSSLRWHRNDWAKSCDFCGSNLLNVQIPIEPCVNKCAETSECTHFTWTNHNNGTCWMKKGLVSKNQAIPTYDSSAICGIIERTR